jgi:S1-C subfamily serine protease
MISVDSGIVGWSYLRLADSDLIEVGNTVYALGSPLGLINTMTEGIVSHKDREVDGDLMIQFTAPISFGSGGSALLNARGQVIGVASSSFSYGQNLNLAVPVNFAKELVPGDCVPLEELLEK